MPTHTDPTDQYTGRAPYNFVPLNDKVVAVSRDDLPDRSVWHEGRLSGVIECSLCTEAPLYIGGSDTEEVAFFHHGDPDRPVIPGSSLRGLVRTLVEIITFSKLQPISDKKLFYRNLYDTAHYQSRFMTRLGTSSANPALPSKPVFGPLVKAGIFHSKGGEYWIEVCDVARVDYSVLHRDLRTDWTNGPFHRSGNRWFPLPQYQGKEVTVDVDPLADHPFPAQYHNGKLRHGDQYLRFRKVTAISDKPSVRKTRPGILVLTGRMQFKHMEFVFLPSGSRHPDPNHRLDDIVERFEDDDQISEWQEKAFPKDQPPGSVRRRDGALRNGEPVFYLEDDTGKLEFIGRAQLFRLPFGFPSSELRYSQHKAAQALDMAEAIFGFVDKPMPGQGNKKSIAAGRVSLTDALLTIPADESVWLDPREPDFYTHILATPKPSAYAHYIVQEAPNVSNRTQLSNHRQKDAIIRGHKLYWHQTKSDGQNAVPLDIDDLKTEPNPMNPAQYPKIKPIRPGVSFAFKVYFEDLTDAELGALLWAITLPGSQTSQYRHKLGMGKPLGMGSVRLTVDKLSVLKLETRLGALFVKPAETTEQATAPLSWETGLVATDWEPKIKAFTSWMEAGLGLGLGGFDKNDRIQALRDMLRWPGIAPQPYMDFEEHKQKLVLPTAQRVYNQQRVRQQPKRTCPERPTANKEQGELVGVSTSPDAILASGTEIRAMVIDVTAEGVSLEPIGLPESFDDYYGFIPAAALGGRQYKVGHPARVLVTEVKDDAQQILCQPRPRN